MFVDFRSAKKRKKNIKGLKDSVPPPPSNSKKGRVRVLWLYHANFPHTKYRLINE